MLNNQKYKSFPWVIILVFVLVSCNTNQEKKGQSPAVVPVVIDPPVVIAAGKPEINLSGNLPSPQIVNLSRKPPAAKKPADFFVHMPNFNTEQGLALSSILCGFRDKAGNLWFGTSGNGVSKYDGKSFTNFSAENGLIHNLVNCITEDSKGNMWFGTYGGVSKYNGKYFENYTTEEGLVNNDAIKIHEDKKGNIWISTSGGISRLSPVQNDSGPKKFINYTKENGLKSDFVGEIFEDSKGNLWFAADFGINKYDPAGEAKNGMTFVDYSRLSGVENKAIYSITEDGEGMLWFGTSEGVVSYDPSNKGNSVNSSVSYTTADGLVNNSITCSLEDREGNLWFGTKGGVSRYNPETGSFLNFTTEQGLANNLVYSVTEDKSGSLWFGTLGGGLSRYDGLAIVSFTEKQGLAGETVFSLAEDKTGNIWIGTREGGITKYENDKQGITGGSYVNYTIAQGLPDNSVTALTADESGNLWFGTMKGLSEFDGKSIVNYTTLQGLVNDNIVSITADRKGNIWAGTYEGGVSRFDGKSFVNYTAAQGLVQNTVWCILEDKSGTMWFATRGGLSRFDGTTFINFTTAQGLPDNNLSSVIQDKSGNILIGSWGGGISVIRKEIADRLSQKDSLESKDAIFENFSTTEGLSNNVVYSILEADTGDIIIGTNLGFTVLKGGLDPTGKKPARDGIETYNQKTGYPINDINNNSSMFADSRGIIWAGTSDKLVRFDYKSVHRSIEAPGVFIQSIKINNENVSWYSLQRDKNKETVSAKANSFPAYISEELNVFGRKLTDSERDTMISKFSDIRFDGIRSFYALPENLVLPYGDNNISFDFAGIETARPLMVRYRYMLKGYDKNWSPVSEKATAGFGNLTEGRYTFIVKAQGPDGVWSDTVNFSFKIRPPWYRSWPAYLFYALLLVIIVILVDRYQRKRLVLKERQRAMNRELEQAKEIEKAYTELKSTQAQLIQAEKMASLGELTAGIAHEIQNPLNFVNNFSEVSKELLDEMKTELENGNTDDAKEIANDVIQNLEKINHHGKRADAIVKGMLQHSRSSSGVKEPTDINALADEYLRIAYHGLQAKDKSFHATLKTDFDETIGKIDIIPQDIGRVILNLITNAFYAVDEKKKSLIRYGFGNFEPTVSVSTIHSLSGEGRGEVLISVKDNGPGIPQKVLDKIFQPFFTTKPTGQGTGLGLSLAYDIVKAHGGELKVETMEDEGTEFIIHIPI